MRTDTTQVIASFVACTVLNRQGVECGKPGHIGLPAGVCVEHALQIYRAVAHMIDTQRDKEAS